MRTRPSDSPIEDESDSAPSGVVGDLATSPDGDPSPNTSSAVTFEVESKPDNNRVLRREDKGTKKLTSKDSGLQNWETPRDVIQSPSDRHPRKMIPFADAPLEPSESRRPWRSRVRSPWACSLLMLATTILSALFIFCIYDSLQNRQLDPKGCEMSYMRPAFAKLSDFDTEHTRFASKYSLYLYKELGVDEEPVVRGVPVLFVPGNAGSYKQVRPLAAEACNYFHDVVQHNEDGLAAGMRGLDFFTVDLNDDITAFHGQTLLDQAEYLNEAVAYILSLYHDPTMSRRSGNLPDPSSVIIVGHSMGGIVARTMLTLSNYQSNSVNTIITMSAPHARPPVSFDSDIVKAYKHVNDYWRHAYLQKWANNNPLWHVTTISIAGGSLDSIVPSDYTSLASIVPETHGFTVFTSSIPNVWTGADHLSILWCNQFREVIIRALIDIVDVRRPSQTKQRAERMRLFKKWFLTGMEPVAERTLPQQNPTTLLTLEDDSNSIISQGERLVLRSLGPSPAPIAHLLPIPPQGFPRGKKFTLMTNHQLDKPGEAGNLEVLFCSVFPLQAGHAATLFALNMDLSGNSSGSTRLACKNSVADEILLPASTPESKYPFDPAPPFHYLQYSLEDLAEHQFVAVVDKASEPTEGWVLAEFTGQPESTVWARMSLLSLLFGGLHIRLPSSRPTMMDIKIPAIHSSLLTYKLSVGKQECSSGSQMFAPLMRQYIPEPYESKFYVNVKDVDISMHGIAPFMPPPLRGQPPFRGLSLQIWSDPICDSVIDLDLSVDVPGSWGKLYMRYRLLVAALPLLVVALVLRKQFKIYDETGVFITFSEGTDLVMRSTLPILLIALTLLASWLSSTSNAASKRPLGLNNSNWRPNGTESVIDYTKNDLLLGSQDTFFWFLLPLFGIISVGVTVVVHYMTLAVVQMLATGYNLTMIRPLWMRNDDRRNATPALVPRSPQWRIITTGILLFTVATFIPYQFAYMAACLAQFFTCVRAIRVAQETRSGTNYNFYNYAHSIFILMLWMVPINLPVLLVWFHNLVARWLTPFSSHHNVLSVAPIILLVETLASGSMIPRVTNKLRVLTDALFFTLAIFTTVYGVTYAYLLHHFVNLTAAWLVGIHFSTTGISLAKIRQLLDPEGASEGEGSKKMP